MRTTAGLTSLATAVSAAVHVSLRYSSRTASSTAMASSAPYAIACLPYSDAPLPKATAVTLPPRPSAMRRAAPNSSVLRLLIWPSLPPTRTRMPDSLVMRCKDLSLGMEREQGSRGKGQEWIVLSPRPSASYQLRFAQLSGQRRCLLGRTVALNKLNLALDLGDIQRLEVEPCAALAHFFGAQAEVCCRPHRHLLAGRLHDLGKLRVAGLAQLVADADDTGRRHLDGLERV